MRLRILAFAILICLSAAALGCSNTKQVQADEIEVKNELIKVGFSQIGAESDWRSANTESMKSVFTAENGYQLIFEDAQQKQTNQIMAIRSFIQQEVDYIVLAPVTETGWDTVLGEAKDAGIPVIIVDRMVDVKDESLYSCWVGSDFELEGQKVCAFLDSFIVENKLNPADINIVDIQGTIGASAQIGRTKGLKDACREKGWKLVAVENGEFTQTKGREVTEALLKKYPEINVIYCENDNEALGALEAIESFGKVAGSDIANGEIMVLSFDGINKEARRYLIEGKIACIGECNPLHGPRVEALIDKLESGMKPDKLSFVDEGLFSNYEQISSIMAGDRVYPVISLVEEEIIIDEE